MYNKELFNDWVPKPMQILMMVLLLIVVMPLGGVYNGNISFMVGGTGAMQEYFLWASYATTIGMGASIPVITRIKMRFKVRDRIVILLVILGSLSYINTTTFEPMIIVITSLIIGFLKMIVIVEAFLPLMGILGGRGIFYGIFYTFALILTQVSSYYAVEVSVLYNYQQFFILAAVLCFVLALLCWILMHDKYFDLKVPLYYIDWLSILLFVSTFMFSAFVFSFGKQQDWLNSANIINASIAAFMSFALLAIRQMTLKRPYISFSIFTKSNVLHGLFMLLCLGMFVGTTSIQNIYSIGVLGYDQLTNAKLNIMMTPGMFLAGLIAVFWFKKERPLKMLIFSGFASMTAYAMIMYFSMVLEFNYESWYLPMFLKGYGMCSLFISIWYYTLDNLKLNEMLAAIGLVLIWRTFLTVGFFSAIFSWFQYQFQIVSLGDLAVYMDGMTIMPQTVATNMKAIQLNTIIAANKKIFGYIIVVGFGVMIYVLTHHFGYKRTGYSRIVRILNGIHSSPDEGRMKEKN